MEDLYFLRLWDVYSPMLTENQREITDLYFNYDLSLGEIAEQRGVSRQSVSDCLKTCRKQMEEYEEKLHVLKERSEFSSAVEKMTENVSSALEELSKVHPDLKEELSSVRNLLSATLDR